MNSSLVNPACFIISLSVPFERVAPGWFGTVVRLLVVGL